MSIKTNTASLQNLLDAVNNLPEAGTDLPELSNEGSASDLLSGKELIDSDGNVVTGTIATKTSSNLTASGATVTVPAGYYVSQATKSVATATQATPSVSIDSAGKITASATQSAGYVTAGTKSATKQLTTQAAKTITPSTSAQTAVAKNVYTTGAVTVAAIPSTYVKPTTSKGATTYTPTTTNQTIAAGTYLTGAQTIKGDSNLVSGNIKSGVSIFGVNGTLVEGGGNSSSVQIASGTFVSDGYQETLSISGLSFKPSNIVIEARTAVNYIYGYANLYILAKGNNLDSYAWHKYKSGSKYLLSSASSITVNFLEDGFELTIPINFGQSTYYWTAIGG